MLFEIALVLALIVLNGVLAMSELAIVSARPARLKIRAARGEAGAAMAMRLAADPGRFLSTVQIGITLVGVLSGALSGATLGARFAAALPDLGVPARFADALGVGLVVVAITYLSLIVGELVPKQIALRDPETIASRMAPAMRLLSIAGMPLVWVLERSGRLLLTVLGQGGTVRSGVSDEEIRMIVAEAANAGVIEPAETEMISGVMRVADRSASGLMTPRRDVEVADAHEGRDAILERFQASGRSRLPLRDGGPDDIMGVLHSRDLLRAASDTFDARALALPAAVVPDTLPATRVIERLKTAPAHMLLVYDEHGGFQGVITPMDVLGAIAGGFDDIETDEPEVVERMDGSLLVAGWMPADELAARLDLTFGNGPGFETVAGLVLERVGDLPEVGRCVTIDGWIFEVVDMDGRRIDKLLVRRVGAQLR